MAVGTGQKRRRGNLLIVLAVFITISLLLGGLFSASSVRATVARTNVVRAGDLDSYITIANLCADAFKEDLEWQGVTLYPNVANPSGWNLTNINYDVFEEAIDAIQNGDGAHAGLKLTDVDGGWQYQLVNPINALTYAGINDNAVLSLAERLLDNADVKIVVHNDLSVYAPDRNAEKNIRASEQYLQLDDITFTVTLQKGVIRVQQDYVLSGEVMVARFTEAKVQVTIDGTEAENRMLSQTAIKNYVA